MIIRSFLRILIGIVFLNQMNGQSYFEFAGEQVAPSTKQHFKIPLSDGEHHAILPITVFHGSMDGPVLGITAGVHGYEYAPILASQALIGKVDPKALKGTIILVQIANVPSFLGRSPYTNPDDGINLNRAFPGNSEGSITERIAHYISTELISKSDYFVDMHSGDAPEDLMAYSAYYQNNNFPDISERGRQMASHMGFDHVIIFKTTGKSYMQADNPSLYCSAEAFKQGIPAVDIECGRLGIVEQHYVDKITVGVERLLAHLGMIKSGKIEIPNILYIDKRSSQSSEHTGFFYPEKSSGDYVKKGMQIGYITDFFGQTIDVIQAEVSGVILYMLGTPPINKGETIVNIGIVENE